MTFVFQPMTQAPTILHPQAQPAIIGWTIGYVGTRSDELPVRALMVIQSEQLMRPDVIPVLLHIVKQTTQHFESFRNCDCLAAQPCGLHQSRQRES